jgi:Protein of unknown function (DUF3563)
MAASILQEPAMSSLLQLLHSLLPTVESQTERDEAYLADATDLHDLERRMRSIDQRGRNRDAGITQGLYTR